MRSSLDLDKITQPHTPYTINYSVDYVVKRIEDKKHVVGLFLYLSSGVTTAPATPAMQGGGTLGGRHISKLTVF